MRRHTQREAPGVTVTVRDRASKKPVKLAITNKVCFVLRHLHSHMCGDIKNMCPIIHLYQVQAGIPREGAVTVQREEQEICEVAVSRGADVPLNVQKHRGWFPKKSKKTIELEVTVSSPPPA